MKEGGENTFGRKEGVLQSLQEFANGIIIIIHVILYLAVVSVHVCSMDQMLLILITVCL